MQISKSCNFLEKKQSLLSSLTQRKKKTKPSNHNETMNEFLSSQEKFVTYNPKCPSKQTTKTKSLKEASLLNI